MTNRSAKKSSIHDPRYKQLIFSLIELREDAGLSQATLASILGLTQPDISKIERCQRRVDFIEVIDWIIATKGDVKSFLEEFLGGASK